MNERTNECEKKDHMDRRYPSTSFTGKQWPKNVLVVRNLQKKQKQRHTSRMYRCKKVCLIRKDTMWQKIKTNRSIFRHFGIPEDQHKTHTHSISLSFARRHRRHLKKAHKNTFIVYVLWLCEQIPKNKKALNRQAIESEQRATDILISLFRPFLLPAPLLHVSPAAATDCRLAFVCLCFCLCLCLVWWVSSFHSQKQNSAHSSECVISENKREFCAHACVCGCGSGSGKRECESSRSSLQRITFQNAEYVKCHRETALTVLMQTSFADRSTESIVCRRVLLFRTNAIVTDSVWPIDCHCPFKCLYHRPLSRTKNTCRPATKALHCAPSYIPNKSIYVTQKFYPEKK